MVSQSAVSRGSFVLGEISGVHGSPVKFQSVVSVEANLAPVDPPADISPIDR